MIQTEGESLREVTHQLGSAEGGTSQDSEKMRRARETHFLESAERRTCQNSERKQKSKWHSHPGEYKGRDKSGQRKKVCEQGALTSGERRGGTSKGIERKRGNEGHSRSGERKGRDKSKRGKKARERATLTY